MKNKVRPIAIHLPQFHPIPENDEWWGKGFTEWTNVTKAKPLFREHYQPHLPADLGFYDLRLEEARLAQEALAKEYGIFGFCYYHYWFNGKVILEKPVEKKLGNPKENLPFMLCWANENWSRRWDGSENEVLLEQNYTMEDHRNHIRYLMNYFKDPRYITIDNKPVFAVYQTDIIPNFEEAVILWQEEAAKEGLTLYIIRFESVGTFGSSYMKKGIDAATEFQPSTALCKFSKEKNFGKKGIRDEVSVSALYNSMNARLMTAKNILASKSEGVIEYKSVVENDILLEDKQDESYKLYKCVTPGWDNSARKKKNFLILKNSTPELFEKWTEAKLEKFKPFSEEENLFFVNAWNEWAEGNHLEPCQKWGRKYLEVLKKAFGKHL